MTNRYIAGAFGAALAALCLVWIVAAAPEARAQDAGSTTRPAVEAALEDSVTVVPGARHRSRGALHDWLLGDTYRDVWPTPIRVPVLDIDTFAGGLEPMRRGGGQQTAVLHLMGANGRRYVFRSVDKRPVLADLPPLRNSLVGAFAHTLPAHLNPGAAPVVVSLLDAVGVLHAEPTYAVMSDNPRLGEHREEFAGMLGMIEERPNELEGDEPGFRGFTKIIATETLRDRLEESPEHRVAIDEYLAARIIDILVGDWDRHDDQWRWAEVELPDGGSLWRPIPRDRDHAFVDHDGALIAVGRPLFFPKAVPFNEEIEPIFGLTINARDLDRELLAGVPWETYAAALASVRSRITDDAIERAVRSMPPELYAVQGDELAAKLRARTESLPEAIREWYLQLSELVVIRGTDQPERVEVERLPGAVAVRMTAEGADEPYLQRTMPLDEIREIRVFLRGDDDHAVIRGHVDESALVRVIGGGGDDVLVDSSTVAGEGRRTTLHDDRGENRFVEGPNTSIDRHPYDAAERELTGFADVLPPDYGSEVRFVPAGNYRGSVGLVAGGALVHTRFGFRHHPYAHQLRLQALYATGAQGFAIQATGDFPRRYRPGLSFLARASQIEAFRFFGFGNQTTVEGGTRAARVERDEVLVQGSVYQEPGEGARIAAGPIVRYGESRGEPDGPLERDRPYGIGTFGQVGGQADILLDRRDETLRPLSGFLLTASGSAYPPVWDVREPFGRAELEGRGYVPLPLPLAPTLALRAGTIATLGDFPVHEAAFLGGSATVRGYPFQRFAGESAAYGNAELRTMLTRTHLLLVRPETGLILLADAGRVFMDGESSGTWHTSVGAGLWFEFTVKNQLYALSTVYAQGETGRVYLKLGMPF